MATKTDWYWNKLWYQKSYDNIFQTVDDPSTTIKLTFFGYLAGILGPYLKKNIVLTLKSMVPYMYADLEALVKNLLQIIVKYEEIEKCKTGPKLNDLDLTNGSVFLDPKNTQIWFWVEKKWREAKSNEAVIHHQISALRKEANIFVVAMLNKLFERCSLVSNVMRSAAIFDPIVLVSLPKIILINWMKALLMEIMESKVMTNWLWQSFKCVQRTNW